ATVTTAVPPPVADIIKLPPTADTPGTVGMVTAAELPVTVAGAPETAENVAAVVVALFAPLFTAAAGLLLPPPQPAIATARAAVTPSAPVPNIRVESFMRRDLLGEMGSYLHATAR